MSRVSKKQVYLDNAASTPVDPTVLKEINKTVGFYGNPSSYNDCGREARKKLERSRLTVARFLGAHPEEIIFTSSGSESNNLAILGSTRAYSGRSGKEILTSPIEHPSVLEPLRALEGEGWKVTYLKVDKEGRVILQDLEKKLNPRVALVSVMYANNEIGTIQPITKISKVIRDFKATALLRYKTTSYPLFHVDACQATGYLDMNANNLGVDLMTLNGSKIYGPKGIGVLYVKRGIPIKPLIYGGNQEHGLRAGTESLPAIAGLAKAVSLISKKEAEETKKLRDYFIEKIEKIIPEIRLNGPRGDGRLANNVNVSIPNLDSENLLLELDKYGIYASAGSACTAHSVELSHVLRAIGSDKKHLGRALRFSLGKQTTKKDIDYLLEILPKVIGDLKKRYS
ncbi:MAG: hypothetical protein A3B91_03980 [Candidatus Yanofskybacteria bacterium RIFCSPHIGHO2_02_FULL_41_29]|uniref:Aminotransferase class V domain-containing protein n=1 Tax=Candidatus Yanofskybacteria bacterium RIFCSPHIGHO2_01_FULL_41_53 TaxID=1802663 RepID=A0A1F8EFL3_9BACT|nr:MAG: hypothetical protein A2650_02545 [Candidatus Yanofskybacteria bacterium RIFCSPHIGHO2_01_FULL_41_53]OGN10909.1 MAG: hypothetical protein A3B91_03980 [Candidatus Yanofskybacteria bacterium RIFCSPHIGHO2_02_FULL_41_29]OGN19330.1 MAG: hypothetical protein A3F48_01500 [Candidatus Yanofskybacteria bacterium RIFCSPHIGHO2_12_FULL_41_9]OGN21740.1 MAG: hypothetical protein A2916_03230 [Candidatus Yanofskybacteria bacterium RIFCSPLOWO2_01_FULL_41_67]OGN29578.1 MAG: hypothetical protein A3H54_01620 